MVTFSNIHVGISNSRIALPTQFPKLNAQRIKTISHSVFWYSRCFYLRCFFLWTWQLSFWLVLFSPLWNDRWDYWIPKTKLGNVTQSPITRITVDQTSICFTAHAISTLIKCHFITPNLSEVKELGSQQVIKGNMWLFQMLILN